MERSLVSVGVALAMGGCARVGLRNLEEVEGWPGELGAGQRRGLRRKQQKQRHNIHHLRWRNRSAH